MIGLQHHTKPSNNFSHQTITTKVFSYEL